MKKIAQNIQITKASGEVLPFSSEKLMKSLLRAGAEKEMAETIVDEISLKLYEGVPTKKIYKWAFNLLRDRSKYLAAKYHLKRGIMELGPSGYPFEKFLAEILIIQGYSAKVGELVTGKCVTHEVDVIAQRGNEHFMIECKYHNHPGTVCDVKVPLYIHARFLDVEASWIKLPGHDKKFHQGWVVTNTRYTTDAIKYGTCAGLKLVGWDYPNGGSLRSQIDELGLYPLTCLTTLTKVEKQRLLDNKIVLTRELIGNTKLLEQINITPQRIRHIISEATQLCERLKFTTK